MKVLSLPTKEIVASKNFMQDFFYERYKQKRNGIFIILYPQTPLPEFIN